MNQNSHKTITIRITQEEYEQLRQIAKAENRFLTRQAAYWVKHGIRGYFLVRSEEK